MPLNTEILKAHINPLFIETGTYLGEGVAAALEAGFGAVWTVDLDAEHRWESGQNPAKSGQDNVTYRVGDSALFLDNMLQSRADPATFWLDAHPVGYFKLLQPDLPLLRELFAIAFNPVHPNDIILIDDIRLFEEDDRDRLRGITHILFPGCETDLIDSSILPQDILRVRKLA